MKQKRYIWLMCLSMLLLLIFTACAAPSPITADTVETDTTDMPVPKAAEAETESNIPHSTIQLPSLKEYFFTSRHFVPRLIADDTSPAETTADSELIMGTKGLDHTKIPRDNRDTLLDVVYSIRLTPELERVDGTFWTFYGLSYFHYRNAETGQENLLIYLEAPSEVDLILVFETYFGNTEDFRQAVRTKSYFPAKLIACENASTRGNIVYGVGYIGNTHHSDEDIITPLDEIYHNKIAISSGNTPHCYVDLYCDPSMMDEVELSFHMIDQQDDWLMKFNQYIKYFGIFMDPSSDIAEIESDTTP